MASLYQLWFECLQNQRAISWMAVLKIHDIQDTGRFIGRVQGIFGNKNSCSGFNLP